MLYYNGIPIDGKILLNLGGGGGADALVQTYTFLIKSPFASVVVGYTNAIPVIGFNRTPKAGEVFLAYCISDDDVHFYITAQITNLVDDGKGGINAAFTVLDVTECKGGKVDQTFSATSTNAQSGKAINKALTDVVSVAETYADGKLEEAESYADGEITKAKREAIQAAYQETVLRFTDAMNYTDEQVALLGAVPDYVLAEAEEVADKVLAVRNAHSFVFGAISDLHTTGSDTSAAGVLHAGMGMNEINNLTQLDMYAIFGDIILDRFNDTYKEGFKFVRKSFAELTKSVPLIQMQGNHDELSADTTEQGQQKYYAYIGANNVGTVTDYGNKFRNYGYRDFENYKLRVIYLNTADVSDAEVTGDYNVSTEQLNWLKEVALNLDDAEWGIIVLSHHPLNWYGMTNLLTALDEYKGKGEGAEFIAHFHGHIHNFRVETLGTNGVLSITIPNACFGRNNEYGTHPNYSDKVHTDYGDTDTNGNQRQFNKTADTAEDTAFNVVVVDRQAKKIHCINYGAGFDRVVSYEPDTPDTPSATNQIPISTDASGAIYGADYDDDGVNDGYKLDTYISSTGGADSAKTGYGATGFIPIGIGSKWGNRGEQILYLDGIEALQTDNYTRIAYYDANKKFITMNTGANFIPSENATDADMSICTLDEQGYIKSIDITAYTVSLRWNVDIATPAFIRFSAKGLDGDSSITLEKENQPVNEIIWSKDEEDNFYNGGRGCKDGYRINSSGVEVQQSGMCCTGFIRYDKETICLKNVTVAGSQTAYLVQYGQDKSIIQVLALETALPNDGNGVYTGKLENFTGYIRITCGVIGETAILTLDEPIE